MANSKAYELPSKKKFPDLYKHDSNIYLAKGSKRLSSDIEKHFQKNMSKEDLDKMRDFLFLNRENLEAGAILRDLTRHTITNKTREIEFVLALQGKKLRKDMFFSSSFANVAPLWETVQSDCKNKPLLTAAETLHDLGEPLTKKDMTSKKSFDTGRAGSLITNAARHGNLEQIKTVVEMNGEKLTKQDLMAPISSYGSPAIENKSIVFTALRTGQFDVVEQVLTDEGTSISANEFLDDFNEMEDYAFIIGREGDCLGQLLASPVFKDTSKNIKEMWNNISNEFKVSKENQKGYQIALGRAKYQDVKNATKLLNKSGIAALKKDTGR